MTVYLSSGCFGAQSPGDLLCQAHDYGIGHLELSSGMTYRPDFMQPIRDKAAHFTYLVHNYFPPPPQPFVVNLASAQPETLARSKLLVKNGIDLSVEFGAPFYSVHAGFGIDLRPEDLGEPEIQARLPVNRIVPRDRAYQTLCETVAELVAYAAERNIALLLENNVVTDVNVAATLDDMLWMATPDEFVQLIADVNHPMLGVLLDVGHLGVAARALRFERDTFAQRLHSRIRCLHLSDNDGRRDTNQPIGAGSWFMPLLRQFATVAFVLEVYNLTADQLHEQIALVKAGIDG